MFCLLGEKELANLVSEKKALDSRIGAIGMEKLARALEFRAELLEVLELDAGLQEKLPEVGKASFDRKRKFAGQWKKGHKALIRLGKELLEIHSSGGMREEDAKRLAEAIGLARKDDLDSAIRELGSLQPLVDLQQKDSEISARLKAASSELEKEANLAREGLAAIREVEGAAVDEEAVEKYSRLLESLSEYGEWRLQAIAKIKRKPVSALILPLLKGQMPQELGFPETGADELRELYDVVGKENALAALSAAELLEMARLSQARLKHSLGSPGQFIAAAYDNREWLSSVAGLESTGFLEIDLADPGSAAVLKRYLAGTPVPQKIVSFLESISSASPSEIRRMRDEAERKARIAEMRNTVDPARKGELEERLARSKKLLSMLRVNA